MKALIVTLAVLASGMVAKADGFVCTSQSGLVIRVYNHLDASAGTRNGSMMIISEGGVSDGKHTIARFNDVKGTLSSSNVVYTGNVDLRFSDTSLKGRNIGGTKLGFLDQIILTVDFSYAAPVADGQYVPGTLTLVKRNGEEIEEQANCARYLKN